MSIKIAALLVAALMTVGVASASESEGLEPANIRLDDVASMQRGARLFFNYCSGCHSLQYLRYSRIAEDLQLDPKDVEKNFMFVGGKIGDPAINHMHGLQTFCRAHVDPRVAHHQITPFNNLNAHLASQVSMLEVGAIIRAGSQQHHRGLRHSARGYEMQRF